VDYPKAGVITKMSLILQLFHDGTALHTTMIAYLINGRTIAFEKLIIFLVYDF